MVWMRMTGELPAQVLALLRISATVYGVSNGIQASADGQGKVLRPAAQVVQSVRSPRRESNASPAP